MDQERFACEMDDILSSGNGMEFTEWHREEVGELFTKVATDPAIGHDTLFDWVNEYYANIEVEHLTEGELETIGMLLSSEDENVVPSTQIVFVKGDPELDEDEDELDLF